MCFCLNTVNLSSLKSFFYIDFSLSFSAFWCFEELWPFDQLQALLNFEEIWREKLAG